MEDGDMKSLEQKRTEALAQLGQDRPVLAGSLNRVVRKDKQGRVTEYWLLTFKQAQKTRSVYVPKELVKEVQTWILNYRRIKKLLAQASTLSMNMIQKCVPERRAAAARNRARSSSR
jgi:hypothetical protein